MITIKSSYIQKVDIFKNLRLILFKEVINPYKKLHSDYFNSEGLLSEIMFNQQRFHLFDIITEKLYKTPKSKIKEKLRLD